MSLLTGVATRNGTGLSAGLKVVTWNVAGIASRALEDFLAQLTVDTEWDIALLQEFKGGLGPLPARTRDGHVIFAQPPEQGRRRSAILVHQAWANNVIANSTPVGKRFLGINFVWGGLKLFFVAFHGEAGHCKATYRDSLQELEDIAAERAREFYLVIGADVQDTLGVRTGADDPSLLGGFIDPGRGWKAELFYQNVA